jgi:hypothetical protein
MMVIITPFYKNREYRTYIHAPCRAFTTFTAYTLTANIIGYENWGEGFSLLFNDEPAYSIAFTAFTTFTIMF